MFKISKMSDYGLLLMTELAKSPTSKHTAAQLAVATRLSLPMVAKTLKLMSQAGLLASSRGVNGGFALILAPEQLSLANIISALEGPIALTSCQLGDEFCTLAASCNIKSPWQIIQRQVIDLLERLKLTDLMPLDLNRRRL